MTVLILELKYCDCIYWSYDIVTVHMLELQYCKCAYTGVTIL